MTAASVYIHVPFCRQRCAYCDFFRVTDAEGTHPLAPRWFDLLRREMLLWAADGALRRDTPLRTIYMGGGTPSLTPPAVIGAFLRFVRDEFTLAPDCEVTMEMQPGTTDRAAVEALARAGVNRFSVGAQTFRAQWLELSGRRHTPDDTRRLIRDVRDVVGTRGLSIDLIAAWPGQDMAALRDDLDEALAWLPGHLSVYELTFKDGTALLRASEEGTVRPLDEDARAEMFATTARVAAAAGLARYEVSNFALPGCESRHNSAYWMLEDYVGLGAGAHSMVWPQRFCNENDLAGYAAAIDGGRLFRTVNDTDDTDIFMAENLFMALRLTRGVDLDRFAARVGSDPRVTHADALRRIDEAGLARMDGPTLRLTDEGILRADTVAALFV